MKRSYTLGLLIIAIFIGCIAFSGKTSASTYTIGDTFTFTLTQVNLGININGTDYSSSIPAGYNTPVNYTVTNMNSTTVTLSYQNASVTNTTYATIDGFVPYVALGLIGALVFNLTNQSTLGSGYFSNSSYTGSNSSTGVVGQSDLPMFASGNVTYYQSLFNNTNTSSSFYSSPYDYNESISMENNQINNNYLIGLDYSMSKNNTAQQYNLNYNYHCKINIDLTTNIVTYLSFSFYWNVISGPASFLENMSLTFVEGTGLTTSSSSGLTTSTSSIPSTSSSSISTSVSNSISSSSSSLISSSESNSISNSGSNSNTGTSTNTNNTITSTGYNSVTIFTIFSIIGILAFIRRRKKF